MEEHTIFEFVKKEEAAWMLPITIVDGWEWNMKEHIRKSSLYKNSNFTRRNSERERENKPFKNIVRPLLNFQYRAEGFDVKDITLYVDDEEHDFESFLAKKYNEQWTKENHLDELIDEGLESVVDYGGALFKNTNGKKPELVPLTTLAFCDQTNMLSGPLAIKHFYSPSELMKMKAFGWGDPKNSATVTIEEAIILSQPKQIPNASTGKINRTPGKYLECYEVHGTMPESWLTKGGDEDTYIQQMQILLYYYDEKGEKQGLTLFAGRAPENLFKQMLRDKIPGRALGFGGVEELFDAQVWTNYNEIVMKRMLDAASKVIFQTTDTAIKGRHPRGLAELDNLEIIENAEGTSLQQVPTTPVNIQLFNQASAAWTAYAQNMASATGATAGESPGAKVSFNALNLLTQQGLALHTYRQGKYAIFIGHMYTDWILPTMAKELAQGKKFLQELSLKELEMICDAVAENQINNVIKTKILTGKVIDPAEMDQIKAKIKANFMKKGNKRFLEIFKGEMKDLPLVVHVDILNKQKDLAGMTSKITGIIQQIVSAPGILQQPGMADLFNQIIEYSGLNPVDFSSLLTAPAPKPAAPTPANNGASQFAPKVIPIPLEQQQP